MRWRRSIAENFITVLSGLDPDPHWSVRAALADVLGALPPDNALPRLQPMLNDVDQRVMPFALASLVKLKAPNAAAVALDKLKADDFVVRAAAAAGVGDLKPPNGAAALADAYRLGQRDGTYTARAAALAALVEVRRPGGDAVLQERVRRQGLGGARPRGATAEAARSGRRGRRRRADPPRANDARAGDLCAARLVSPPVSTQAYSKPIAG